MGRKDTSSCGLRYTIASWFVCPEHTTPLRDAANVIISVGVTARFSARRLCNSVEYNNIRENRSAGYCPIVACNADNTSVVQTYDYYNIAVYTGWSKRHAVTGCSFLVQGVHGKYGKIYNIKSWWKSLLYILKTLYYFPVLSCVITLYIFALVPRVLWCLHDTYPRSSIFDYVYSINQS